MFFSVQSLLGSGKMGILEKKETRQLQGFLSFSKKHWPERAAIYRKDRRNMIKKRQYKLTDKQLLEYETYLREQERAENTIQKYIRDLKICKPTRRAKFSQRSCFSPGRKNCWKHVPPFRSIPCWQPQTAFSHLWGGRS